MAGRSGTRFACRASVAGRSSWGSRIDFSSAVAGQSFFQIGSTAPHRHKGQVTLTPARLGLTGICNLRLARRPAFGGREAVHDEIAAARSEAFGTDAAPLLIVVMWE